MPPAASYSGTQCLAPQGQNSLGRAPCLCRFCYAPTAARIGCAESASYSGMQRLIPFSLFSVFFLSAEQIARLRRLINRAYDTAFLSIYRHTDRSRREQRRTNPALGGQLFFEHNEGKQHRNQDAQPVNRHDDADLPLLNRVIIAQPRQSSRSRCSVCRNIRL